MTSGTVLPSGIRTRSPSILSSWSEILLFSSGLTGVGCFSSSATASTETGLSSSSFSGVVNFFLHKKKRDTDLKRVSQPRYDAKED